MADPVNIKEAASNTHPKTRISEDTVRRSAAKPVANPYTAPSFPPMVERAVKDAGLPLLAQDQGVSSTFGWAGTDPVTVAYAEGVAFLGYSYLAALAQRAEYRVVTETIASEMTREWIDIKVSSDKAQKNQLKDRIEERLDALNARDVFRRVAESDGFFGRGHLYIDTGMTDSPDELITDLGDGRSIMSRIKIGPEKNQRLIRLQPVEATWVYPTFYESVDPLKRDWYNPVTYYVMSREIHRSRLLTFVGRPVPDILKPAYAFGGLSMSQMLKPYVDNWLRTRQAVSDMIQNFSHNVLRTNLDATLGIGGDQLFSRIALFNNIKNNQGCMVIDKDTEDWSNVSIPVGSLDHLQAQAQEHMAAISRIPLVKLLGIQPAGLNASSEGELVAFEDWVASFQETLFRPALTTIIDLIQLSEFGFIDDDLTFEFKPLRQLKPIELAQLNQIVSQTRNQYYEMGAVDATEMRETLAEDKEAPFQGLDLSKPLPTPPGPPAIPGMGGPPGPPQPPGGGPPKPGGGPGGGQKGKSGAGSSSGGVPKPQSFLPKVPTPSTSTSSPSDSLDEAPDVPPMPNLDAITRTLLGSDAAPVESLLATDAITQTLLGNDAEFDPAEHPRGGDPENVGRFSSVPGAAEARERQQQQEKKKLTPRVQEFVSPNVGELSFAQAQQEVTSRGPLLVAATSKAIDSRLKLTEMSTANVIGAWADGAENTLMVELRGDPQLARAAAAIKGSMTNQKSVLTFAPRANGKSIKISFIARGDLSDIHKNLLQHGVENHTLEPVEGGAKVHVVTDNEDDAAKVAPVAALYSNAPTEISFGDGEFIGTDYRPNDTRSDDEQRGDAQTAYGKIIEEISTRLNRPDIRETWHDARNHWRAVTTQAGIGLVGSQGDPALISTRRPTAGGAMESDRYRRIDLDAMRQDSEVFNNNMALLKDSHGYPNLRPNEVEGKSAEEIAQAAIKHAVANLKYLYGKAPKELREQAHMWYEGAHNMAQSAATKHQIPLQSAAGVFAALSPQKDWNENVYLANKLMEIHQTKANEPWTKDMERKAAEIYPVADYPAIKNIYNKKLSELTDPIEKAMWIRTYDETTSSREYQIYSPDGRPIGRAENDKGEPLHAAWQSNDAIAGAIQALESGGDRTVISSAMGDMHKVRSFYNNILDPHSKNFDVTMDTHAVGAALLRPLTGKDTAVMHNLHTRPGKDDRPPNWKGASGSSVTGIKGTYALWADAYRKAAKDLGIEPRVLQSAVWETKRKFLTVTQEGKREIEAAWQDYHNGKSSLKRTQDRVWSLAEKHRAKAGAEPAEDQSISAMDAQEQYSSNTRELYPAQLGQYATGPLGRRGGITATRGTADWGRRGLDDWRNVLRQRAAMDQADWQEHLHPRGEGGKFVRKGTGTGGRFTARTSGRFRTASELPLREKVAQTYSNSLKRYGFEWNPSKKVKYPDGSTQLTFEREGADKGHYVELTVQENGKVQWKLGHRQEGDKATGTGLGDLWSALGKEGIERGESPIQVKMRDDVKKVVTDLGYDANRIIFSEGEKKFLLNGEMMTSAAETVRSGPDRGKITFFAAGMKPDTVKGTAAHEVMHQKFDRVLRGYENQEYEIGAKLYAVYGDPAVREELRKTDGVTEYSMSHWQAYENATSDDKETVYWEKAVHETLAEMAYADSCPDCTPRRGAVPAQPAWQRLYKTVNDLYKDYYWGGSEVAQRRAA